MKTVINYTIDTGIFVKFKDLDRDLRMKLCKFYFFTEKKSFSEKPATINLISLIDFGGEKCLKFPSNESYFKDCIKELDLEVGEVSDLRVLPKIEGLTTSISLRENQAEMLQKLEKVSYNAIIAEATSFGKSLTAIKLCEMLQTTVLFIASRNVLLENIRKDALNFGVKPEQITDINTSWLSEPNVTPILIASIQALNNPEILAKLKDRVGIVIYDECHLAASSSVSREILYSINSKYNLYLSATYKNLTFENLELAVLSSNIIKGNETLDYNIHLHELIVKPTGLIYDRFYQTKNYSDKKNAVFLDKSYIEAVTELVAYTVLKANRGCLIYLDNTKSQELFADALREYGLKVGVLNQNTSKKENKYILDNYDNGEIDVIVGGVSLAAGISLYRLSTTFDLSLRLNENALLQLIGRSKRQNIEICNKSKLYIKISTLKMSEYSWKVDKKILEGISYIKLEQPRYCELIGLEMIKSLKDILI